MEGEGKNKSDGKGERSWEVIEGGSRSATPPTTKQVVETLSSKKNRTEKKEVYKETHALHTHLDN